MRLNGIVLALCALLAPAAVALEGAAKDSQPQSYPLQGENCNGNALQPADIGFASLACPGTSTTPLNAYGECVFINNTGQNVYFIPLRTQTEWVAFRAAAASGGLAGLTLVPCAGTGGTCGSANGTATTDAPATNLCSVGTPSAVTGTGPWNWSCAGSGGGTSASCSAPLASCTTTTQQIFPGENGQEHNLDSINYGYRNFVDVELRSLSPTLHEVWITRQGSFEWSTVWTPSEISTIDEADSRIGTITGANASLELKCNSGCQGGGGNHWACQWGCENIVTYKACT